MKKVYIGIDAHKDSNVVALKEKQKREKGSNKGTYLSGLRKCHSGPFAHLVG